MQHALQQILDANNGMIYTHEAEAVGISRQTLSNLARKGVLIREAHGLYVAAGDVVDEFYRLQRRCTIAIFSHATALYLCGLSDRVPFVFDMTVPQGKSVNYLRDESIAFYFVQPELLNIGLIEVQTSYGHTVRTYEAARALCDVLRNRRRVDNDIVVDAVKAYMHNKHDLNALMRYAERFGVSDAARRYLEVLV